MSNNLPCPTSGWHCNPSCSLGCPCVSLPTRQLQSIRTQKKRFNDARIMLQRVAHTAWGSVAELWVSERAVLLINMWHRCVDVVFWYRVAVPCIRMCRAPTLGFPRPGRVGRRVCCVCILCRNHLPIASLLSSAWVGVGGGHFPLLHPAGMPCFGGASGKTRAFPCSRRRWTSGTSSLRGTRTGSCGKPPPSAGFPRCVLLCLILCCGRGGGAGGWWGGGGRRGLSGSQQKGLGCTGTQ